MYASAGKGRRVGRHAGASGIRERGSLPPRRGVALAHALPSEAEVVIASGCHSSAFFTAQEPPSLAFLAHHLAG